MLQKSFYGLALRALSVSIHRPLANSSYSQALDFRQPNALFVDHQIKLNNADSRRLHTPPFCQRELDLCHHLRACPIRYPR